MLSTTRPISLPIHAALRMLTGLLTMLAPFLAGFEPPALLMSVVVGAIVTGVALAGVVDEAGHMALPVSTLQALDYGLVLGLFAVAAIVAAGGDAVAGVVLGVIAAIQLAGNALTKYSLA